MSWTIIYNIMFRTIINERAKTPGSILQVESNNFRQKAKALWQRPPILKISVETPYVIINTILDPKGGEGKTKIAKLLLPSPLLPSLKSSLWHLVGGVFPTL